MPIYLCLVTDVNECRVCRDDYDTDLMGVSSGSCTCKPSSTRFCVVDYQCDPSELRRKFGDVQIPILARVLPDNINKEELEASRADMQELADLMGKQLICKSGRPWTEHILIMPCYRD